MLKKEIKYTNWEGEEETGVFYFNMTERELLKLETEKPGGFEWYINRIKDSNDEAEIIQAFEDIILKAYGVRSEDGKRFIKSDEIALEFTQTPAFDALFMELATTTAMIDFIKGVWPKDYIEKNEEALEQAMKEAGLNPGAPSVLSPPDSPPKAPTPPVPPTS